MATKKTTTKATTKTKSPALSSGQKVGIGVGLTAAAVAAAGAYFLYGSEGAAKNRVKVKSWALKAKAEVLETLESAQEMTQEEYEKLIETVSGAYSRLKDASKVDIATFKKEMKAHWKDIASVGKPVKKAAATAAKKASATKTAVKKAAKKATK